MTAWLFAPTEANGELCLRKQITKVHSLYGENLGRKLLFSKIKIKKQHIMGNKK